jgi:PKD repeat protein
MKKLLASVMLLIIISEVAGQALQTVVLRPGPTDGKDAVIASCVPCGFNVLNYGNRQTTDIIAWTNSGSLSHLRTLMQFDLSIIPAGVNIVEAKLNLYYAPPPINANGPHQPLNNSNIGVIRRITGTWVDSLVTWQTQPPHTNLDQVILPPPTNNTQDFLNIDITGIVNFHYNNPLQNFGLKLMQFNETPSRRLVFGSSDHPNPSLRPMLEITYEIPCLPLTSASFTHVVGSGGMVNFTNTSVTNPGFTTFQWNFGDGNTSTATSPTHVYSTPGLYNACLILTDTCWVDTICNAVRICPPPGGQTISAQRIGRLSYQFSSSNTGGTSYNWNFGDGNTSTLQNPTHTYQNTGNYNVCLIVVDSCFTDTICQSFYFCGSPTLDFNSVDAGAQGLIQFFSNRPWATSYLWNFGNGSSSTQATPVHFFSAGVHNICLISTDSCGTDTICKSIKVCNRPALQFSVVEVAPNLYEFTSNWANAQTYHWDFGNGSQSGLEAPIQFLALGSAYNVCLQAVDVYCDTQQVCELVNPCNLIPLSISSTQVAPLMLRFNSNRTQANSFSWDFGNGNSSSLPNPTATYSAAGTYYVCLTTTDACATETHCDSAKVTTDISLDSFSKRFSVYPNPAKDQIFVEWVGLNQPYDVKLTNSLGQVIYNIRKHSDQRLEINIRHLPSGLYFMTISQNGRDSIERIAIQR